MMAERNFHLVRTQAVAHKEKRGQAICGGRLVAFDRFAEQIRSAEELATIIGTPSEFSLRKELKTLDGHMRRFIAHSPFVVVSTHSADGKCDASPRGDPSGFVHVIDDRT